LGDFKKFFILYKRKNGEDCSKFFFFLFNYHEIYQNSLVAQSDQNIFIYRLERSGKVILLDKNKVIEKKENEINPYPTMIY